MRNPKKRIIYSNYNLDELFDDARQEVIDRGEEPTETAIWNEIYEMDNLNWEEEKERLTDFFEGGKWIAMGTCGRWNGTFPAGLVFTDFMEFFNKLSRDCDYYEFSDINGHFHVRTSHHDGDYNFEIRKLTPAGIRFLDNWSQSFSDNRPEREIHKRLMEKYSVLPHFVHNVYGCPKTEYETKAA